MVPDDLLDDNGDLILYIFSSRYIARATNRDFNVQYSWIRVQESEPSEFGVDAFNVIDTGKMSSALSR